MSDNPYPGRMERIENKVDALVDGLADVVRDVALIKQRLDIRDRSTSKWYDRVIVLVTGALLAVFAAWLGAKLGAG